MLIYLLKYALASIIIVRKVADVMSISLVLFKHTAEQSNFFFHLYHGTVYIHIILKLGRSLYQILN